MGNPYAPKPPGTPPPDPRRFQPPAPAPEDGAHLPLAGDQATSPAPQGTPRTPRPPVDPDAARLATRSVMHFGLLMLATLLTSTIALPWRLVSVAIGLLALVVGIRALRRIWRAGLRGFLVVAMSAGVIMTFALALTTLAVIPVWQIEMDRQSCLNQAITLSATSTCESDYQRAITEYQKSLTD
ncbi:hypothetical protein [Sanguibacter suarezii]|uniref:hypothetical protein n=1 Tax=Sanguibacter suarezii TaxID=60921 RepID=UPI000836CC06|nr:hypothetical protein [Sanguibacter suarezii]